MKKFNFFVLLMLIFCFLCSCGGEPETPETSAPELILGELPDYSDSHAEDAPYPVFSSDLEPISSERFEEVRQVLYKMLYQSELDIQCELLKDSGLDDDEVFQKAFWAASQYETLYNAIIMNPDNQLYDDYYTWLCDYAARYYGTVNGCEIICLATFIDRESVYELGGVKIESPNPIYLFVCKEKEMLSLAEAYEKEWLTAIDILLIAKRNCDFNAYWAKNDLDDRSANTYEKYIPELEDLSEEKIAEIFDYLYSDIWAESYSSIVSYLHNTYGENYNAEKVEAQAAFNAEMSERSAQYSFFRYANTDPIGWRYYGIIGGYVVFAEVDSTDAVKNYHLGEYQISFGNGAEMWIYSSEVGIIEIDDAYQSGLLTDADAAKIYERHNAYNEYIFK